MGTDHEEDQAGEIEALNSIFPDDFQRNSVEFMSYVLTL